MNEPREFFRHAAFDYDPDEVKAQTESGEYFLSARRWYDDLYHKPLAERCYFIVITLLCATTILFSYLVYQSMFPLSPAVPYPVTSADISQEMPLIKPLRVRPAEDLNLAVARYLAANYVEARESYLYDVTQLEWRFNRVRSTSDDEVFVQYQQHMNPENTESPLTKYGRTAQRSVTVQRVIVKLEGEPKRATVHFTAQVEQGGEITSKKLIADIAFRLPELKVNTETNKVMQWNEKQNAFVTLERELYFRVTQYDVRETL